MAPRNFYEDDEVVSTTPGLNEKMPVELEQKESIELNKDVSIFQGMTIRSPEFANKWMKDARLYTYKKLVLLENEISTTKSAIKNEFHSIETKYNEIVKEPVLPSLIYILTGTLTGSIIVRNRALPIRFITPLLFGTAIFSQTMPKTWDNSVLILQKYEKQWPELYETHRAMNAEVCDWVKQSKKMKNDLDNELISSVGRARKYLNDLINK